AAAAVFDERAERRTQWQLVVAGPLDVSAQAIEARSLAPLGAVGGVDLGAMLHNRWNRRYRLDVVDDCRAAIEPNHRPERRLDARVAAFALQRFEQGALLAADVGARAAMDGDVEIVAAAQDILAKQTGVVCLLHRARNLPLRQR